MEQSSDAKYAQMCRIAERLLKRHERAHKDYIEARNYAIGEDEDGTLWDACGKTVTIMNRAYERFDAFIKKYPEIAIFREAI